MQWFARSWASGLAVDTVARKSASLARPRAWAEQLPVSDYRIAAFTAMLMDVDEKGFARYLADEVVRARFREPTAEATPIVPGEVYK